MADLEETVGFEPIDEAVPSPRTGDRQECVDRLDLNAVPDGTIARVICSGGYCPHYTLRVNDTQEGRKVSVWLGRDRSSGGLVGPVDYIGTFSPGMIVKGELVAWPYFRYNTYGKALRPNKFTPGWVQAPTEITVCYRK